MTMNKKLKNHKGLSLCWGASLSFQSQELQSFLTIIVHHNIIITVYVYTYYVS